MQYCFHDKKFNDYLLDASGYVFLSFSCFGPQICLSTLLNPWSMHLTARAQHTTTVPAVAFYLLQLKKRENVTYLPDTDKNFKSYLKKNEHS